MDTMRIFGIGPSSPLELPVGFRECLGSSQSQKWLDLSKIWRNFPTISSNICWEPGWEWKVLFYKLINPSGTSIHVLPASQKSAARGNAGPGGRSGEKKSTFLVLQGSELANSRRQKFQREPQELIPALEGGAGPVLPVYPQLDEILAFSCCSWGIQGCRELLLGARG